MNNDALLKLIKQTVMNIEPGAEVILYGSRARADAGPESDWDLLILLDGEVNEERADSIRHRLYEIEWEHDAVIMSVIRSRDQWDSPLYRAMPFHENIEREGIIL